MREFNSPEYEQRDVYLRGVLWTATGLAVTLIVIFIAIRIFESVLASRYDTGASRRLAPNIEVPPPRLQTNPASDLAELRAAEEAQLSSYGWVDRQAGVIRIPIERAIELTAERGLPARQVGPRGRP